MTKSLKILLILLAALVIVSFAFAVEKGTLKVKLVDDEGNSLPGVTLTLSSPIMMGTKTMVTNDIGEALFINLTPGKYELKSTLAGFQERTSTGIEISLDRQTLLQVEMKPAAIEESITVTAVSPAVDTTKSVIAEYVTHDTVESLPVARDFIGYLQLAAGVNVIPNSQGRDTPQDPAGKGGLNYSDRGAQGITGGGKRGSRDNLYFLDSMNITGLGTQTAQMTFNNEVIQEQQLMTSGVPAEYGGGKGVVGNIVTKSGGNRLTGSANIYFQSRDLFLPYGGGEYDQARDPSKLEGFRDNKYDTAGTLGGPIFKDRIWFFGSGQYRSNKSKFSLSKSASAAQEETEYIEKRTGLFGKASFKLTPNDSFTFSYFVDDYNVEGSRDVNLPKSRQYLNEYKMGVYSGFYQRVFGENLIVDFRYGHFWRNQLQGPRYEDAGVPDTLYYLAGTYPPIDQYTFGAASTGGDNKQKRDQFSGNIELYLSNMRIKAGLMYSNEYDSTNTYYHFGEDLRSLNPALSGWTLGDLIARGIFTRSEAMLAVTALNFKWDTTSSALDLNGDRVISIDEVLAAKFTTKNDRGLNFWRIMDAKTGENKVRAMRWTGYLMDDWKVNEYFTLNAGVRVEDHNYKNSEGGAILHMKPIFLPRIGLVWNIGGRGTHKLTAFYGHFSDPMPFGMIHFAGNISGRVRYEQLWLNNAFYTYRQRGSPTYRDCEWVPNTKDGFAREASLTHEIDVGNGLVFATQAYYRSDKNIIEDYDMNVYTRDYKTDPLYGKYSLTYQDFGYGPEGPAKTINYFLSNLIGAKRNYYGIDFEASKRFSGGSMFVAQYSYKDARGNSQSDGNADLQGDMIELDPRLDWMWGPTPGTIKHKIKLFGTYRTSFGLDIGALLYWNSGMVYTESYNFMPGSYDIFLNWPKNSAWTDFVKTGQEKTPAYYQLDLKFNYGLRLAGSAMLQLFMDIYNVTNNQAGFEVAYARNDQKWLYQETTEILLPMRFYAGARIRF